MHSHLAEDGNFREFVPPDGTVSLKVLHGGELFSVHILLKFENIFNEIINESFLNIFHDCLFYAKKN